MLPLFFVTSKTHVSSPRGMKNFVLHTWLFFYTNGEIFTFEMKRGKRERKREIEREREREEEEKKERMINYIGETVRKSENKRVSLIARETVR